MMCVCLYVCLSVCLFVPKDLANRWIDRVLLNRVASLRSLTILGDGTTTYPRNREFNATQTHFKYNQKTFKVPLEASRGVAASISDKVIFFI